MSHFDEARRAAVIGDLLRHLRGRPVELLSFDEVRHRLRLKSFVDRGIEEVPLEQIQGTLGRAHEFNRVFLPRQESLRERWTKLDSLARGAAGFPPVELYKVGEVYFVVDGHHRVSVARSLGAPTIEARVSEFLTPIPLDGDESPDEILLRSALLDFLEATGLDPGTLDEYLTTEASGPQRLLEHVNVHRYYLGTMYDREFSPAEAVASWRDTVFRPVVSIIRTSGIMEDFPDRTETDLYLFVMDHLHSLRERYGRQVEPGAAVRHLRLMQSGQRSRLGRFVDRLRRLLRRPSPDD